MTGRANRRIHDPELLDVVFDGVIACVQGSPDLPELEDRCLADYAEVIRILMREWTAVMCSMTLKRLTADIEHPIFAGLAGMSGDELFDELQTRVVPYVVEQFELRRLELDAEDR